MYMNMLLEWTWSEEKYQDTISTIYYKERKKKTIFNEVIKFLNAIKVLKKSFILLTAGDRKQAWLCTYGEKRQITQIEKIA